MKFYVWCPLDIMSYGFALPFKLFELALSTSCSYFSGWGVGFSCEGQSSLQASSSYNGRNLSQFSSG